jgi:SpoVK/Ycf46/Vps4 family AAA+-type ATPase
VSYKETNSQGFLEAAHELIDEERKMHHVILANELGRILENGTYRPTHQARSELQPLPRDSDRGTPLLEIRRPDRHLEDMVLSDDQRDTLSEVVEQMRSWEVLESNALRPSNKLLFCGPPGCGKTATAEALCNLIGLPLLYVRFDSVVSSLLGETAANLRKVFDFAARDKWVLFFDEFDGVGRSRDDATEHGELKRVVNTFLQMLDRFGGKSLVIAATNFEQSLDPALWRRFDEVIRFELPNRTQIKTLLERRLRNRKYPASLINEFSGRLAGMSHAEIERVCLDVLKQLALKGLTEISTADFLHAIQRQERRKQALAKSRANGRPRVNEA